MSKSGRNLPVHFYRKNCIKYGSIPMIKYGTDLKEMYRNKIYNKKIDPKQAIKELAKHGIETDLDTLMNQKD